jgi:hypothetical protein
MASLLSQAGDAAPPARPSLAMLLLPAILLLRAILLFLAMLLLWAIVLLWAMPAPFPAGLRPFAT